MADSSSYQNWLIITGIAYLILIDPVFYNKSSKIILTCNFTKGLLRKHLVSAWCLRGFIVQYAKIVSVWVYCQAPKWGSSIGHACVHVKSDFAEDRINILLTNFLWSFCFVPRKLYYIKGVTIKEYKTPYTATTSCGGTRIPTFCAPRRIWHTSKYKTTPVLAGFGCQTRASWQICNTIAPSQPKDLFMPQV